MSVAIAVGVALFRAAVPQAGDAPWIVLALYIVFVVVALAIDRRALLVLGAWGERLPPVITPIPRPVS